MTSLKLQKNISLKPLTSFKIGGIAKYFISIKKPQDLQQTCQLAKQNKLPVFILGGGSNILVSDQKLNALVIKLTNTDFKIEKKSTHFTYITAGGGLNWDKLVKKTINLNLQGLECLSGIPGSVGASPTQNIGAYGQEIKDTFHHLTAYDIKTKKFTTITKKQTQFGYRDSIFKQPETKNRYIIFSVTFKLKNNHKSAINYDSLKKYLTEKKITNPSLQQIRHAVLIIRKRRLENPHINPNAGSFFKNPIINQTKLKDLQKNFPNVPHFPQKQNQFKIPAGWLIEQAGLKGIRHKDTAISSKNALILTNPNRQSTYKQMVELSKKTQEKVHQQFKIHLKPEVQFINFP